MNAGRTATRSATALLGSAWPLGARPLILVGLAGLVCCILADLVAIHSAASTPRLVPDFFAFWSAARFIHTQIPAEIYHPATLHGFQVALGKNTNLPFLYPPGMMLLLWPLALFPYFAAFTLWVGAGLTCYLSSAFERQSLIWVIPMLLVAPASVICASMGQNGLLIAGFLVGGLRLAPVQPVLAGVVLGLATVKPQLAILVPFALIAAGLFRTLVAAAATALGLALLSSIAFGWSIWPIWIGALPTLAGTVVQQRDHLLPVMPTVQANLQLLGFRPLPAGLGQVVAGAVGAFAVLRGFRSGPSRTAIAVLLAATLLVTPYAVISDLPLVTAAAVLLIEDRMVAGRALRTAEIAILALAIWLPYLIIGLMPFRFSSGIILLLLALAAAGLERSRASSASNSSR